MMTPEKPPWSFEETPPTLEKKQTPNITARSYEEGFTIEDGGRHGWQVVSPMGGWIGSAWDFYSHPEDAVSATMVVLQNPFPDELRDHIPPRPPLTKDQAEKALVKLKKHIRAVIDTVPLTGTKARVGASKFWKP